ncbi:MAG: hypothetical protein L7H18_00265 [Candidatus Nealsonbacteria bacterium DGGOD1a]|jgi:hypothetical protein|nr:MAG: hypothetical protein L7H18_00265 [Candidatus Nealsonbacteria bacterium DGGOD1a]
MNESYSSKLNFGLSGQSKSDKVLGKGAIDEANPLRSEEIKEKVRPGSSLSNNSIFNRRGSMAAGDAAATGGNGLGIGRQSDLDRVISRARENAALKAAKMEAAKKAEKAESLKDNLKKSGVFTGGDFNSTGIKKIGSAVGENWKNALPNSSVGTGEKTKKTFGRMFGVSSSDARVKKDLLIKMGKAIEAGRRDDPSLKGWSEEEKKYVFNSSERRRGILGGIGGALGGEHAKRWKNN